jgi:hypothetical protein
VIEANETERVARFRRRRHGLHAGKQRRIPASLDEPEGGVAERCGNRKGADGVVCVTDPLDVADRRPSAPLEQLETTRDVADPERDRADAVGVLLQVPRGPAAVAHGCRAHHGAVSGAECERALAIARRALGTALAEQREVEVVYVEAPAALEITNVVVDSVDPEDAQTVRGFHRHSAPQRQVWQVSAPRDPTLSGAPPTRDFPRSEPRKRTAAAAERGVAEAAMV